MNIIEELQWRDAIYQQTDAAGLKELTEKETYFIILWHGSNRR
ncbi:tyrosyl-tRNA ligase [Brochothrix campestris FSL F6-1037]|uniref:Tyrosyl-tRNA ligase n=1 Tax=Brochothrix campestris FSL F6-1037 TaxID=1265861 RepID=W7C6A2_9LIST|nr:tyrosyl-tRNA ligase [Brochothrix campestris FSL F6-1037]